VGAFSVTNDCASFVVPSLSAIAGLQHGDSGADSEEDFEDSLRRSHAIIPLESMGAQDSSRRQTVASFGARLPEFESVAPTSGFSPSLVVQKWRCRLSFDHRRN
jgi:hypothetical protein